ncbi:MAG: hypothetical protein ACO38B_09900 [Burkholderiaceae bacterium]
MKKGKLLLLAGSIAALTAACTPSTGIGGRLTGGGGLSDTAAFNEWVTSICFFSADFYGEGFPLPPICPETTSSGGHVNFNNIAFSNCGILAPPVVRGTVQVKDAGKGTWTCDLGSTDSIAIDGFGLTALFGTVSSARNVVDSNGNNVSGSLQFCEILVGRGGPEGRAMVAARAYSSGGEHQSTQGGELTIGNLNFHKVNDEQLCRGEYEG